jgi:hypothetical protein
MCPGSFMSNAMRGCASPGSSPLRQCSTNRSRMMALTRCAPIMHAGRWRPPAQRRCTSVACSGTTRAARMAGQSPIPPEGDAKCPWVELTIPGRGFSSCCGRERIASGLKEQFSFLEPLALSPKSSIWGEPMSGIDTFARFVYLIVDLSPIDWPTAKRVHGSECPQSSICLVGNPKQIMGDGSLAEWY